MRALFTPLLALPLLAACQSSSTSSSRNTAPDDHTEVAAKNFCSGDSWVAGSQGYCAGRFIYRDYVYDDYGADLGLIAPPYTLLNLSTRSGPGATQPGPLSPSAGDVQYPAGAENSADILSVEASLEAGMLHLVVTLNTLHSDGQSQVALALDTDNDPGTGGGEWEGLGIRSDGWDVYLPITSGNAQNNRFEVSIPRPQGDIWRLQAVAAQADGSVMNVAFRGTNEQAAATAGLADGSAQTDPDKGNYWEDRQAAALAAGDISEFGAEIKVGHLETGHTQAPEIGPGFYQRVYRSAYSLGEGISLEGVPGRVSDNNSPCEQRFHFLGEHQPYGFYLPAGDEPHGLQLVLHGCSANHASKINQANFRARFGDDHDRILVSPLGRGPTGFYSDISERDVLDALTDTQANYSVDDNRVFVSGYSMGGYGAMRLAALYPDRFAGMINWVGFSGSMFNTPVFNPLPDLIFSPSPSFPTDDVGAVGNVIDFLVNLRHIPSVYLYSGADYLVPVHTGLAVQDRVNGQDHDFDFYLHPVAEHLTYILLDDWQKEAEFSAGRQLRRQPAQIDFRTDESLAYPEYQLRHDKAYWISEIRGQEPGYIDISLRSHGCAVEALSFPDSPEFDGGFGPAPLVWERSFKRPESEVQTTENRLSGSLRNVASLRIDAEQACLSEGTALDIDTGGQEVTLHFSDGRTLLYSGSSN